MGALRISDVGMTFSVEKREPVTAIEGASLDVADGEFVAIVGPSGCGKTTLLRILAGLLAPTRGSVYIDGELTTRPRRDVAMMFQSPTLLPWRTVLQNCLLPVELHGKQSADDEDRARQLLGRAGLAGFEGRYPHELSGGMQQRVALCRALAIQPSVLLLDEPFGALDAMTRDQMNLDLHRMWESNKITTVLITHSITEAVFLAQRVVVMTSRPGRIDDVIEVPLPRQRDASTLQMDEFTATASRVRRYFTKTPEEMITP
jgi:NitT/TauT family transport system ATP-binding protein